MYCGRVSILYLFLNIALTPAFECPAAALTSGTAIYPAFLESWSRGILVLTGCVNSRTPYTSVNIGVCQPCKCCTPGTTNKLKLEQRKLTFLWRFKMLSTQIFESETEYIFYAVMKKLWSTFCNKWKEKKHQSFLCICTKPTLRKKAKQRISP